MSVELGKAIKTVFSDNYNKFNIFCVTTIFGILNIIMTIFFKHLEPSKTSGLIYIIILSVCIFIFVILYWFGYLAKAGNNSIRLRKGVFPNPFKRIDKILILGIKYLVSYIPRCIITAIFVLPLVLSVFLYSTNPGNICYMSLIILSLIFLLYFGLLTLLNFELIFLNTLSIKACFDFKNIFKTAIENKKTLFKAITAFIALGLFIAFLIELPLYFVTVLMVTTLKLPEIALIVISLFINIFVQIFSLSVCYEILGQAGRIIFFEENRRRRIKKAV